MSSPRPVLHILLSLLMLFQAATVSGQVYCQHAGQGTQQDTSSGNIHSDMAHHQHHAGMEDADNKGQSGCTCGFDCSGTCMHACQGSSLISHFVATLSVIPDTQSSMTSGLAVTGFTSLPLRPPIIS